jgi:hypothetical protein
VRRRHLQRHVEEHLDGRDHQRAVGGPQPVLQRVEEVEDLALGGGAVVGRELEDGALGPLGEVLGAGGGDGRRG